MIKRWVVSNRETTEPELIINLLFARRPIVVCVHRVTFLFVRSSIWVFIPQSHAKKVHVNCFNRLRSLQIEHDVCSNVLAISGLEIKVSICQSVKPRVLCYRIGFEQSHAWLRYEVSEQCSVSDERHESYGHCGQVSSLHNLNLVI